MTPTVWTLLHASLLTVETLRTRFSVLGLFYWFYFGLGFPISAAAISFGLTRKSVLF